MYLITWASIIILVRKSQDCCIHSQSLVKYFQAGEPSNLFYSLQEIYPLNSKFCRSLKHATICYQFSLLWLTFQTINETIIKITASVIQYIGSMLSEKLKSIRLLYQTFCCFWVHEVNEKESCSLMLHKSKGKIISVGKNDWVLFFLKTFYISKIAVTRLYH